MTEYTQRMLPNMLCKGGGSSEVRKRTSNPEMTGSVKMSRDKEMIKTSIGSIENRQYNLI